MTSNPDPSLQSTGIAYPSKTKVAVLEYPLYTAGVEDGEVQFSPATDDLFLAIDPNYWLLPDKNRYRWDVPPEIKDCKGNNAHPFMSMADDPPQLELSSFYPTYAGKVMEPAVKEGCSDPQTVVLSDNTKIDVSNAKMRFNVEKATDQTLTGVVRFICPPASTGSNPTMWQDRAVMSIDTTGQSCQVTIRCVGNNKTADAGMPPTVLWIEREQDLMTLNDTVTDRILACGPHHTNWDKEGDGSIIFAEEVIPQEANPEQSFQRRTVDFVGTKLERCGSFVQPPTFTYPWKVDGKRVKRVITLVSEHRNGRTYIKSAPRSSGMGACASGISNPASGPGSLQDARTPLMDRLVEGIDATEFYSSLICQTQGNGNGPARITWPDGTNNSDRNFELHAPLSYGIPPVDEQPAWKAVGADWKPVQFPAVTWSFVPKSDEPAIPSTPVDTTLIVAPAGLSVSDCDIEGEEGMGIAAFRVSTKTTFR